jgi:hypothetical protein
MEVKDGYFQANKNSIMETVEVFKVAAKRNCEKQDALSHGNRDNGLVCDFPICTVLLELDRIQGL